MSSFSTLTMADSNQIEFIGPDMGMAYAKLARHVTAVSEILRTATTFERVAIEDHIGECMDMITSLEKWMMNPVMTIPAAKKADGRQ